MLNMDLGPWDPSGTAAGAGVVSYYLNACKW